LAPLSPPSPTSSRSPRLFSTPSCPPPPSLLSLPDTPPTQITPLSLHDALPISRSRSTASRRGCAASWRATRASRWSPTTTGSCRSEETRLNSSHRTISYAVFCLKKKKKTTVGVRKDVRLLTKAYTHVNKTVADV